ncbi:MAG: bifunctional hydroxymethylpyrimidine kinase/phosphomethylpyrimidine kinase [Akkermansiaceae bacterium]
MALPPALSIAGSDCSAGAGLQADLKTFSALGVHGLTAVTCVVAETPRVVTEVSAVPPVILQKQIQLLLATYPIGALKTGMLYSKQHIAAVSELLQGTRIPVVVDPVMVASSGDPLLEESALDAISERLLPLAHIITPNLPEASVILGRPILTPDDQEVAAFEIAEKFDCSCYLKGGHFEDTPEHRDLFAHSGKLYPFSAPHLPLPYTHGTGCTLAAALTAGLCQGLDDVAAAEQAHKFTHTALKTSLRWDTPSGEEVWHLNQLPQS